MEDIWRDISRGGGINIHDPPSTDRVILQDFFSRGDGAVPSPPPNARSTTPTPPPVMLTLRGSFLPDTTTATTTPHIHDVPNPDCNNKRFISDTQPADYDDKNRRHKRMIKNRESAARSRARKQAYTTELELEVAHLVEENARLKKQQQQLNAAAAAQQRKNHKSSSLSLYRTSSAPL